MYFDAPQDEEQVQASLPMRMALSVNGLAVLVFGLIPGVLTGWVAVALQ